MLAAETLLRPTRRYTVTYVDGTRVDVDAEGMYPVANALEFVVTVSVVGIPRQVVARRALLGEVAWVWSGRTGAQDRCGVPGRRERCPPGTP